MLIVALIALLIGALIGYYARAPQAPVRPVVAMPVNAPETPRPVERTDSPFYTVLFRFKDGKSEVRRLRKHSCTDELHYAGTMFKLVEAGATTRTYQEQ